MEYRSRLVEVVEAGGRWCMVTLTVDRSVFSSPEVAYRKVAPCIPDLMRALFGDGAVWARVLEFQEASGEGWPHWHAVVKLPAGMTVNAARRRLWEVWRDRWQFARGGLDLTPVRSRRAAARYLGKYFFKGCTAPPWVLDRDRAPRMFGASVAAGEVAPPWRRARRSRSRRLVLGAERARRSKGKRRTVREALARSGSTVALVARVKDAATGKARVRVLARGIACPFRDAAFAAARGGWGAPAAREGAFVVSRPRGAQAFTVRAVQRLLQAVGGDRVEPYVLESRCAVDARWEERRPSRHRNGQAEGDRG